MRIAEKISHEEFFQNNKTSTKDCRGARARVQGKNLGKTKQFSSKYCWFQINLIEISFSAFLFFLFFFFFCLVFVLIEWIFRLFIAKPPPPLHCREILQQFVDFIKLLLKFSILCSIFNENSLVFPQIFCVEENFPGENRSKLNENGGNKKKKKKKKRRSENA